MAGYRQVTPAEDWANLRARAGIGPAPNFASIAAAEQAAYNTPQPGGFNIRTPIVLQPHQNREDFSPFVNQLGALGGNILGAADKAGDAVRGAAQGLGNYFFTAQGQQGQPAGPAQPSGYDANLAAMYAALGGGVGGSGPSGSVGASYGAGGGGGGAMATPFDPSYGNAAIGAIQSAGQMLSQPKTVFANAGPKPSLEAPVVAPTDYSAYDANMARAAPKADPLSMAGDLRLQGILGGLAQAGASVGEDTPVGTMLLKMGMGMLAGRQKGEGEITRRADEHEVAEQRYAAALAQGDMNKARDAHDDAEKAAQRSWQSQLQKMADYRDRVRVEGGNLIVTSEPDKDGKFSITTTATTNAAMAEAAIKTASIYAQMGGDQNSAIRATVNDRNQAARTDIMLRAKAGSPGGQDDPALMFSMLVGRAFDSGEFSSLLPEKDMETITTRAQAIAEQAVPVTMSGEAANQQRLQAYRSAITASLIPIALQSKPITDRLLGPFGGRPSRAAVVIKPKKEKDR